MAVPTVQFPIFTAVRVLGIIVAALLLIWTFHFRGGIALISDNKDLIFNVTKFSDEFRIAGHVWASGGAKEVIYCQLAVFAFLIGCNKIKMGGKVHPVLMVIGLVILNGEAMLAFRTVSGTQNSKKLTHLSVQLVAFCLSLIGIWAALKFHNDKGIENFYSLHSWLGLISFFLFGIQWAAGFLTYWYPGGSRNIRAGLLPWHIFFGVYIYGISIATTVTGLLEKATFLQVSKVILRYSNEALLINSLGIFVVLLGGLVILALIAPSGKSGRGPTK